MRTIILLEEYVGSSDFAFKPSCTGRLLDKKEVWERKLMTDDLVRRTERSSYISEWYEVEEGDQINIIRVNGDEELDETFIVPKELPNPPQDPTRDHNGMHVYDYLVRHCRKLT